MPFCLFLVCRRSPGWIPPAGAVPRSCSAARRIAVPTAAHLRGCTLAKNWANKQIPKARWEVLIYFWGFFVFHFSSAVSFLLYSACISHWCSSQQVLAQRLLSVNISSNSLQNLNGWDGVQFWLLAVLLTCVICLLRYVVGGDLRSL